MLHREEKEVGILWSKVKKGENLSGRYLRGNLTFKYLMCLLKY